MSRKVTVHCGLCHRSRILGADACCDASREAEQRGTTLVSSIKRRSGPTCAKPAYRATLRAMAQPGSSASPAPTPPTTLKQDHVLNFRVDEELLGSVQRFQAESGIKTQSEACRMLLAVALNQPAKQVALREAVFSFSESKHRFVAKLLAKMTAFIPELLAEETASLAAREGEDER